MPVGNIVRLRLTPEGTSALTGTLGPRVAVAEGALASVRPDGSLMVGVDWIELTTGQRQQWNGEGQIKMRRDLVQSVEARTLDQKKSWMVGAAAAAAAVLVAVIAMKSAGAHTTGDGSRGPPANP